MTEPERTPVEPQPTDNAADPQITGGPEELLQSEPLDTVDPETWLERLRNLDPDYRKAAIVVGGAAFTVLTIVAAKKLKNHGVFVSLGDERYSPDTISFGEAYKKGRRKLGAIALPLSAAVYRGWEKAKKEDGDPNDTKLFYMPGEDDDGEGIAYLLRGGEENEGNYSRGVRWAGGKLANLLSSLRDKEEEPPAEP